MMWNAIEIDPFKKGAAYLTGTRYKSDDFAPYIYKTEDYGKTWKLITNGINKMHFTRVMRADKKVPGLLYAAEVHQNLPSHCMMVEGSWM